MNIASERDVDNDPLDPRDTSLASVRPTDDTWQRRDAQTVSTFQVRFTDVADFIEELTADHRHGYIVDRIVRLAITSRPATLDELEGKRDTPGGERISLYDARHVECSYVTTRGVLTKLSAWCGCCCESQSGPYATPRNESCAQRVMETLHRVQSALAKLDSLDVRGGGLYVDTGNWRAAPDQTITSPPQPVCATCGTAIHFANEQWRDGNARPDVLVDGIGRSGRRMQVLDHIHDPVEVGRKV
jgi:hypothetical protein